MQNYGLSDSMIRENKREKNSAAVMDSRRIDEKKRRDGKASENLFSLLNDKWSTASLSRI